jgi:CheY-like chemotaxis protein
MATPTSQTNHLVPAAPISSTSNLDFATAKRRLTGHRAVVIEEESESFGRMFVSLSSAGCPSTLARRWAQVEPLVRRTMPTMILFSTQLSEMSAPELVRKLRQDPGTKEAVLIAVAGRESKKERRKLLELGCDGYVWKPTDRYLFAMDLVARTPRLLDGNRGA